MSSRYQELVDVLSKVGENQEARNLSPSADVVLELEATSPEKFNGFLDYLKGIFWESSIEEWRHLPRARYVMSGGLNKKDPTTGYQLRLAWAWENYSQEDK